MKCERGWLSESLSGVGWPANYIRHGRRAWLPVQAVSLAYIDSDSVLRESQRPETNRPNGDLGGDVHMNDRRVVQCRTGIAPYTV